MIRSFAHPRLMRSLAIVLFAGMLYPLGFAPFSAWLISPIVLCVLWLYLQQPAGIEKPFWHGFFFGLGTYGIGASWIFVSIYYFGNVPIVNAVLVTAAFACLLATTTGVATWLYNRLSPRPDQAKSHTNEAFGALNQPARTAPTIQQALLFTAIWIAIEWSRTWFLSGFPWLFLGYISSDTPFSGFVPIVGVLGTGALILLCSLVSVSLFLNLPGFLARKKRFPEPQLGRNRVARLVFAALLPCAFIVAGWGLGQKSWTQALEEQALTVHLMQGNIPQSQKRQPEFFPDHLAIYENKTYDLLEDFQASPPAKPQLIIWPEAAIPILFHSAWDTYNALDSKAKNNNTAWISGVPWVEFKNKEPFFYNGVFAAGLGSGFYAKQRLVPFGESMPFPKFVRKFGPLFNLSPVGFSAGPAGQDPLFAQGMTIAPFICYEIVYPSLVRQQAKAADILLTISNDGWFGRSLGPDQHFEMARMRALETGKMLLRATNNGVTAVIGKQGEILAQLPRFEQGILSHTAYPTTGTTPFMIWSHWPILGPALLLMFYRIFKLSLNRKKTSKHSRNLYRGTQRRPKNLA